MKKKNVTKKLSIKKTTITNLSTDELSIPRGGFFTIFLRLGVTNVDECNVTV
ncbi:MAG: hypothetical protein GY765_31785 [bacterium]|nr:hypothetical protein [bacterium]